MYAVIETGGKQYKVSEGDILKIEKLNVEEGQDVKFDKVLLYSNGDELQIGKPLLENVSVLGEVLTHGKGKKIIVFKYKPKKNYRKKKGHRQPFTKVRIKEIALEA